MKAHKYFERAAKAAGFQPYFDSEGMYSGPIVEVSSTQELDRLAQATRVSMDTAPRKGGGYLAFPASPFEELFI